MQTKTLEPRPTFRGYFERLADRPAFQRFASQDEQLAQRTLLA